MILFLVILWVFVAVVRWLAYKFEYGSIEHDVVHDPPEATFLGALSWPFNLLMFLKDRLVDIFRQK